MHINFQISEKLQTLHQYNNDLKKGDAEIEHGDFTTADDLKAEAVRDRDELHDVTSSMAKSIEAGLREIMLAKQGEINLKLAKDLLNEL